MWFLDCKTVWFFVPDNITKDSTAVETEQISQETSGQPVAAVTALSHVVPQQAPSSDGVGKLTSDDYLNALALPLPPPPLPLPTLPPQPFALHQRYLSLPQQPTSHYPPLAVVPSPFVRPVFPPFPIRIHSERSESQSLSYVRPPHFPPPPPRPPAQSLHVAQSQQSIMCSTKPEDGMGEDYLGSRVDRKPTAGRSGERQPTANNPMIIKNYVHTGSVPRFVPRQLVKRSSAVNDAAVQPEQATADPVNEELKRTALTLGPVPLGPALPPDEERRRQTFLSSESGDSSIDQTVAKIREKVQEV